LIGRRDGYPGDHVLLSTLAEIPGCSYEVRGFVFANRALGSMGRDHTLKMVQSLIEQAHQLGGDAIVDITTVIGGELGHCVMTGTAVRLLGPG
jgi:hypothetical protein